MADQGKKSSGPKVQDSKLTRFEEYLYANLLFWGFLLLVAFISFFTCGGVWDDVTSGVMEFLFVIMGGGFTLVSVMDFFYENSMAKPAGAEKK